MANPQSVEPVNHKAPPFVFLGGVCGTTTWRQSTAIPYFNEHSITYFNPQVEEWYPELLHIEAEAKQLAQVLLFVVDGSTRAVASLIEIGSNIAAGRLTCAVLSDIEEGAAIGADVMTANAIQDYNLARQIVAMLTRAISTRVYSAIKPCLEEIAKIQTDGSVTTAQEAFHANETANSELLRLIDQLNLEFASDPTINRKVACDHLRHMLPDANVTEHFDAVFAPDLNTISTVDAKRLGVALKLSHGVESKSVTVKDLYSLGAQQIDAVVAFLATNPTNAHFVYGHVSGSSFTQDETPGTFTLQPNNTVVRPLLARLVDAVQQRCVATTFVIDGRRTNAQIMVQAAFAVGLSEREVNLHLDYIEEGAIVEGRSTPLSAAELKDANRGRDYLESCLSEFHTTQ
jgi:hypothetical protein